MPVKHKWLKILLYLKKSKCSNFKLYCSIIDSSQWSATSFTTEEREAAATSEYDKSPCKKCRNYPSCQKLILLFDYNMSIATMKKVTDRIFSKVMHINY